MPPKRRLKRKAATPAVPIIRQTTRQTARAAAPVARDEPDVPPDARVAGSEGAAPVAHNEEEVEALRQQAATASRKAEELQAQLLAAEADSLRMATLLREAADIRARQATAIAAARPPPDLAAPQADALLLQQAQRRTVAAEQVQAGPKVTKE